MPTRQFQKDSATDSRRRERCRFVRWPRPFAARLPRCPAGAPADRKEARHPAQAAHPEVPLAKDESPAQAFRPARRWRLRTVFFAVAAEWPAFAWYLRASLLRQRRAPRLRRLCGGEPPTAQPSAASSPAGVERRARHRAVAAREK